MEQHLAIASKFEIAGTITEIKPLGPGFINDTFIVKTVAGAEGNVVKFILHKMIVWFKEGRNNSIRFVFLTQQFV